MKEEITAMDLHGALSSLHFAVSQEIAPYGYVEQIAWNRYTYLQVAVECFGRDIERIKAIFNHGILWGPFDYRFRGLSHGLPVEPDERIMVTATVDLSNSRAPSGPINFNNTPEEQRRRRQEYEWGWHR